ncbi:hypothetical protein ACVWZD_000927 [Streptomyces sp. TE3672]
MISVLITLGRGALVSSVLPSYRGHGYPVEVISHCVWLYIRFPLSYREAEELMLQRGVIVSHETVRRWCLKFGQAYAAGLRRRQPRPGDKWHLDEVFIKINGVQKYLWRAVDQDGNVLDILVQNRRDKAAARRFFRRLMKKTRAVPRVIGRRQAAFLRRGPPRNHALGGAPLPQGTEQPGRELPPADEVTRTRDEGLPLRRRSAAVPVRVQRHLPHFRTRRHLRTAAEHRFEMTIRFTLWEHVTENIGLTTAA